MGQFGPEVVTDAAWAGPADVRLEAAERRPARASPEEAHLRCMAALPRYPAALTPRHLCDHGVSGRGRVRVQTAHVTATCGTVGRHVRAQFDRSSYRFQNTASPTLGRTARVDRSQR